MAPPAPASDGKDAGWQQTYDRIAGSYDWQLRLFTLLIGAWEPRERRKLVQRLNLRPGQSVLEVSVGTGSNLHFLVDAVGTGKIVGLDLSQGMLAQCRHKIVRLGKGITIVQGEAAHLPFADESFDAALHYGGINEFGDKKLNDRKHADGVHNGCLSSADSNMLRSCRFRNLHDRRRVRDSRVHG